MRMLARGCSSGMQSSIMLSTRGADGQEVVLGLASAELSRLEFKLIRHNVPASFPIHNQSYASDKPLQLLLLLLLMVVEYDKSSRNVTVTFTSSWAPAFCNSAVEVFQFWVTLFTGICTMHRQRR